MNMLLRLLSLYPPVSGLLIRLVLPAIKSLMLTEEAASCGLIELCRTAAACSPEVIEERVPGLCIDAASFPLLLC